MTILTPSLRIQYTSTSPSYPLIWRGYLCALMRLLDELDIGPARAPSSAYSSLQGRMDEISKFHWLKHMCTSKIEKGTTFFLKTNNNRITLEIWVAVMATENTWQILQRETVSKLENCLLEEGVKDIIRDEFEVTVEIKAMPETPNLCGISSVVSTELRDGLEEIIRSPSFAAGSKYTYKQIKTLQEIETVNNENAAPVQISENQLIIHTIPAENLFHHLGRAGRLSVIGNKYIQRSEINVGGKRGALNRIYLGPADCGKTRSAAEWIHQLTSNHPYNWTILRTDPGKVPENIDENIILDVSMYGGAHEMPQNAILFLDDLPANLPSTNTELDAADAIRRLFTWFKNYPHFHDRRLVGTIRNEDLHARLDWPEVLPTLGTQLELIRLEELSQQDYEQLWRGMSRGKIFISHKEGEKEFKLSLSNKFVENAAQRATNPEGVAKFIFDSVRNNRKKLNEKDVERFHVNAVQAWLDNTWPAMRDNYGIAAHVFITIARFLEAGLRKNSGFKGNLGPLWEYHAAFGPDLCKKVSAGECKYLEVIDSIETDGHAIGKKGDWIRPRWDYLLQTDNLSEVEIGLPDASWFASHSRNLSNLSRRLLAMHLSAAKWELQDIEEIDAPWLLGIAEGKILLANMEEDFENKKELQWEAINIIDELVSRHNAEKSPALREQVAQALVNKGVTLGQLDRSEDKIKVYDELVKRYDDDQTPALRELLSNTLNNKVSVAIQIWRKTQEYKWLEKAIVSGRIIFSMDESCYNLSCALALAGETDEAFHLLQKALENNHIAWTHVHGTEEISGDPDWDDFRNTTRYLELLKRFGDGDKTYL